MLTVGKKMKEFRLAKDWTLADLAKRSGVALSSLSRIETGRMTGTLESHIRIAKALGIRLPELYADIDGLEAPVEYQAGIPGDKFHSGKGATFKILTKEGLRKKILPVIVFVQPGKSSDQERLPVGTEKFVYLLKGSVEITAGAERIRMNPGDSLYLRTPLSHALKNIGPGSASLLSVTSPPSV